MLKLYKNPSDCFALEDPTVSVVDFKIESTVRTKRKKKIYIAKEEIGEATLALDNSKSKEGQGNIIY